MVENYYTHEEVAKKLRVEPKTVINWIYEGKIAVVKVQRKPLIAESALKAFIKKNSKRAMV